MLIVMALAWVYVRFGLDPAGRMAAVRHQAGGDRHYRAGAVDAGQESRQEPAHRGGRVASFALYFLGVNEIALLFGGRGWR